MLETDHLMLCDFLPSDWEDIKALLSDPEVTRYLYFADWTEKQLRSWFDRCIEKSVQSDSGTYNWTISLKDSGTIIGWFGASRPNIPAMDNERTFKCALHRKYWRNGYMT